MFYLMFQYIFKRVFQFLSHGISIKSKTTKNQITNADNLQIQRQHYFKNEHFKIMAPSSSFYWNLICFLLE